MERELTLEEIKIVASGEGILWGAKETAIYLAKYHLELDAAVKTLMGEVNRLCDLINTLGEEAGL